MDKPKTAIKHLLLISLISILLLPNAVFPLAKKTKFVETLIGRDPKGDADPASADILKVYIANNGTHFRFIIKCQAKPAPSSIRSYSVWLNTTNGDAPDYCLVAGGISGLYSVTVEGNSTKLTYKAPIEVEIKGKSIYLTACLSDIDYPTGVGDPVGIAVTTQQPLLKVRDRAPDSGMYHVSHEVIPELPWPTPIVFIPSIVLSVYVIYRRKFREEK